MASTILTGFIARDAVAVTPSDSTDLPRMARGLAFTGAGVVKVTMESGSVVILPAPVGKSDYVVRRVWATGTTATGIVALYPTV